MAIIGLSGAGKSTLIRTINRMHDITQGELTVDGTDVMSLHGKEPAEVPAEDRHDLPVLQPNHPNHRHQERAHRLCPRFALVAGDSWLLHEG